MVGGVAALGLALSGCGLLGGGGPDRDPSNGQITNTATSDAFQIKVGDCLQDPGTTSVEKVVTLPCSKPHDYEAFDRTEMKDSDYPGETAATDQAEAYCKPAFTKFVGISIDDSTLNMTYFYPTAESWKQGDREILCLVTGKKGEKTTGSLKGAKK
ncbi:hypothetical protein UM93_12320 [Psychromicrobium lacuslunae]|uniref:Septum formation-related domain-containing protein n=1 Tax=Psychromicrobium lacuslunae TaxID=1618207 RepID=A0A0D4C3E3_9MICC|nr:hypothetical protein UM93_12320 [Psychromicrobium lacuslunae]